MSKGAEGFLAGGGFVGSRESWTTLVEIALEHGVTAERVRQMVAYLGMKGSAHFEDERREDGEIVPARVTPALRGLISRELRSRGAKKLQENRP